MPHFLLGILLIQTAGNLISAFLGGKIEMYVSRDMRRASFNHLQTLSFSYYNQNSVGYIHSRVMSDTGRIGGLVSWSLMDGVWNLTYMVGSIVAMFMMNWKLCLLVLVIVPLAALASIYFQRHLVRLNRRVREINSQITSGFNEGITGAKTTKTLVAEQRMEEDFNKTSREMTKTSVRTAHFRSMFVSTISFASYIALALVLWRGGIITVKGLLGLGTLAAFTSYAMNLMEPIQWDVDSLDWKGLSAQEITQRVLQQIKPGSIVLFHNAAEHTPEALPGILASLQKDGYTILPISQLLLEGETFIDSTGMQCPK